jgi:GPH family glycoside/pentoside/hexuronide:cation symporter
MTEALPVRTLLAYGGPIIAFAYLVFFVQFYFLKYATDVLLLSPAAVGALFAAAKFWDAGSTPLVGSWSDGMRSAWGRRRPFLLGALPLLGGGFVLLWNPPEALSPGATIVWVGVALFAFFTGIAAYAIPHAALGAEVSSDSHQRTRLFGVKQVSFTLGLLLAFVAIQQAMNAATPRQTTAALALPAALLAIGFLAITPLTVRESAHRNEVRQSLLDGLRDVWANYPARTLVFVWFVENLGVGAVGTMAPYVAQYVFNRPDIVGTLPAAYVLAGIVAIPFWVWSSRRFGARHTWLVAMWFAAAAFGGMMLLEREDLAWLFVLLALAGAAMGCGSVLSSTLIADIIDLDEQASGQRKEGVYSAAMLLALKIGASLATAGSGFVLAAVGFVPNTEQSSQSLFGMRFLFAGLPCLGFVIGALLFRAFPLGRVAASGKPYRG